MGSLILLIVIVAAWFWILEPDRSATTSRERTAQAAREAERLRLRRTALEAQIEQSRASRSIFRGPDPARSHDTVVDGTGAIIRTYPDIDLSKPPTD